VRHAPEGLDGALGPSATGDAVGDDVDGERVRAPRPGEVAWIAALPCALVVLAAIVWLGPLVGHALPGSGSDPLWPLEAPYVAGRAEPVKHGRYLVALTGPPLLALVVALAGPRLPRAAPAVLRRLVRTSQMALVAFLALTVLGQHDALLWGGQHTWPVFGVRKLAVAAALVAALLLALRRPRVAELAARRAGDPRAACLAVAGASAALWLLASLQTDRSAGDNGGAFWTMDDAYAVLGGRTPLVDYHPVYAQLLPYLSAAVLRVAGGGTFGFTAPLAVLSLLALLAVFATLRRVTRSSPFALALFLPMLGAGFLPVHFAGGGSLSPVQLSALWPMRYGGAYLVAWLTARHLDRAAPRRVALLALVAGLVAINDVEFGLPALAASIAALLCAQPRWSRRALARLLAGVAAGVLAAATLVTLLTLVRAGALPRPGILLEYPRIFGVAGFIAQPMPTMGIHLALYVTFGAAAVTAVARRAGRERDTLLTGMLAWSGVFGLLAGAYFVGRSDELKLVSLFSAWLFALALLAVVLVRGLAARGWRRPGVPELAVLFALALATCSWSELPRPWTELARLRDADEPITFQLAAGRFVAAHTRPGERVAILTQGGHRTAYEERVADVAPYSFIEAMAVRSQMTTLVDAMRREGAHTLILPTDLMYPRQLRLLARAGFASRLRTRWFWLWTDAPG
jgi:hypothetical protein